MHHQHEPIYREPENTNCTKSSTVNEKLKIIKFACIPVLTTWLVLSGCAADETYGPADQADRHSRGMGTKGMARGPKGRPPGTDSTETRTKPELPDVAFTACVDKEPGDKVELSLPNGITVQATCQVIEDHLVAVPELQEERGRMR